MAKVRYALLCDDLRQEASGKFIAIGIYGNKAHVVSFPVSLQISALLSLSDVAKAQKLTVVFTLQSGAKIAEGEVDIESDVNDWVFVQIPKVQMMLSGPDALILSILDSNGKPAEVAKVQYERTPTSA